MTITCTTCGHENPPDLHYCERCGAELSPPESEGDLSGEQTILLRPGSIPDDDEPPAPPPESTGHETPETPPPPPPSERRSAGAWPTPKSRRPSGYRPSSPSSPVPPPPLPPDQQGAWGQQPQQPFQGQFPQQGDTYAGQQPGAYGQSYQPGDYQPAGGYDDAGYVLPPGQVPSRTLHFGGEPPYEIAAFWKRWFAFMIDFVIVWIMFCCISCIFGGTSSYQDYSTTYANYDYGSQQITAEDIKALSIWGLFVLISSLYFGIFFAVKGRTLGKMLFGIRVAARDGGDPSNSAAFFRGVFVGIQAACCFAWLLIPVSAIMSIPAVMPEGRTLQDLMCGTIVVED